MFDFRPSRGLPFRYARRRHIGPGGAASRPVLTVVPFVQARGEIDHGPSPRRNSADSARWAECGREQGLLRRRAVKPTERIDEIRETRPSEAVLLSVLDAGEDGLVDSGLRLELPLGPAQPDASALDGRTDQVEAVLLLRVARALVPGHTGRLALAAYQPGIRGSIGALVDPSALICGAGIFSGAGRRTGGRGSCARGVRAMVLMLAAASFDAVDGHQERGVAETASNQASNRRGWRVGARCRAAPRPRAHPQIPW
jgi:hypothetical protein